MREFILKAKDGYELSLHIFDAENPKAVVQIAHGMEEHQDRYRNFAEYLAENGYSVVTADMRGHGKNAPDLGYFAKKKGYELLLADQKQICDYIHENFEGLKVYLFAHSMGTIISRVVLEDYSKNYDKVVLSGYPAYQKGSGAGVFLTSVLRAFRGAKYKSKFIQKLAVGSFNNKIKSPETEVDWVSSNPETVNKYMDDPLCGFGFTVSAFNDLFHLVILMNKPKKYKDVNSSLPFFMISGEDDPCTMGEKGTKSSIDVLKKAGFQNITTKNYPGLRHEILNSKDRESVYADILDFLDK